MSRRSILDISADLNPEDSFGAALREIVAGPEAPPAAPDSASSASSAETLSEPIGPQDVLFDRYRMVRELGRGGMGVVWLAQDTVLEVPVALKLVPRLVVHDTEGITNLKKEVLRGMALTHPGIVRVHSFEQRGTTAGIVMEHVEGESLAQRKARQPDFCFDPEAVRPWLEQLCAALDYAHRDARIAHRDLKPGNLLLTTAGRLKVADFGLASSLSESRSRISARLGVSGTPPYMSPQQALGEPPTPLDDIYSLGATIYELLTGAPPFFRGDILAQVLHVAPPPMAVRRAELGLSARAPIPGAWERTVAACLAKEPATRPASGAAILQMLDAPVSPAAVTALVTVAAPPPPEAAPPEPVLRIVPRPAPADSAQRIEPKPIPRPATRPMNFQPLLTALSVLVHGVAAGTRAVAELIVAILSPLLKVAAVLALLWGLLHLKQKWDAGADTREAATSRPAAVPTTAASAPVPPPIFLPPPPPPGPHPGLHGGPPPPPMPRRH